MSSPQVSVGMGENQQDVARFAQLWEMLAIQIHNLNEARVIAMTGTFYHMLDHAGRRYMQDRMRALTDSQAVFFVRDGMHPDRWLLGAYDDLQSVPGSAIYIINGLPTLTLGGPECPYPNPLVHTMTNQSIIDMNMGGSQTDILSSPDSASDSQADGGGHVSSASNAQDTDVEVNVTKISRPPNAYILYRKDNHRKIEDKYPGIRNNEISVIAGSMWNTETTEVRAKYAARAADLKARHKAMYPDYKYAPRRPEQVKRRAKRNGDKSAKHIQGKITKTRKVLLGDMGKDTKRMLNEEAKIVEAPVVTTAEDPEADNVIVQGNRTIDVGIATNTELETQCDINEWNEAIPETEGFNFGSPLDADMSDFLYTEQFDSGNDGDMDQAGF